MATQSVTSKDDLVTARAEGGQQVQFWGTSVKSAQGTCNYRVAKDGTVFMRGAIATEWKPINTLNNVPDDILGYLEERASNNGVRLKAQRRQAHVQ